MADGDGLFRRRADGMKEALAGMCQLSRHEGEADDVGRSNLVYAAAIRPINWANRPWWMARRCASVTGW